MTTTRTTTTLVPAPPGARGAALVAELTRAAYAGSDPVAGLPVPDGASDTAEKVAAEPGTRLWLACAGDRPVGALRSHPAGTGTHRVARVCVLPEWRGHGVAARALAQLEDLLRAEGALRTEVHAVVERGLPPVYAALGYLPVAHWPSPDKPLSEVTLHRILDHPRAPAPNRPAAEPAPGWPLSWFTCAAHTLAVCTGPGRVAATATTHRALAERALPGAVWHGVDVWPADPLPLLPTPANGPVVHWPVPPEQVPAQLMPRTVHPGSLALWRRTGRKP